MLDATDVRGCLPMAVSVLGLFALVFGLDATFGTSVAGLGGLLYLLASPATYRELRSLLEQPAASGDVSWEGPPTSRPTAEATSWHRRFPIVASRLSSGALVPPSWE